MGFSLKSHDFNDGEVLNKRYSCEGDDMSPDLEWDGSPQGTRSYALIVEDPDAPGEVFTHWIVFDMPATFKHLDRGMGNDHDLKDGIKQGATDFGHTGYGGPCPPRGHGRHRYNFIIKALDIPTLGLTDGAEKSDVLKAIKGHILGESRITGVFERR
ncbi:MAG: YbhB/YbcL family Raf kinase inhibitor-like protein [Deltaproteobacteria bacterium]